MKPNELINAPEGGREEDCVSVAVPGYLNSYFDGKKYVGNCMEIFFIVMNRLNICYKLLPSPKDLIGLEMTNGTWTGALGQVHRKEADMIVCPVGQLHARYPVIDFSGVVFSSPFTILYRRPGLESNLVGFIMPFTYENWILTFASLLVITLISVFLNKTFLALIKKSRREAHYAEHSLTLNGLWLRALAGQDVSGIPREHGRRVLIAVWLVMAMILGHSYKGNLKALLIIPKITLPFDSLEELVNQDTYKWTYRIDSFLATSLKLAYEENPNSVMGRAWGDKSELYTLPMASVDLILNDGKANIVPTGLANIMIATDFSKRGDCRMARARELFLYVHVSFGFAKNSTIMPKFNQKLSSLREAGILDKIMTQDQGNASFCGFIDGSEIDYTKLRPLKLDNFTGIFYLYVFGNGLASLIFILELFSRNISRPWRVENIPAMATH